MSNRFVRKRKLAGLVLASTLVVLPGPLWAAQPKEPSRAELEERIRRLEEIIRKNGLDKPAPAPAAKHQPALEQEQVEQIIDDKLKKQKVTAGFKDGSGFFIESPSGDFKVKLRGLLQADSRWYPTKGGQDNNDNFYLRRARPILEGTAFKYFDFQFVPDFGLGTVVIQDAYSDVTYYPMANMRFGKFKDPFSLERLQSAADVQFVERSLAQTLAPNRDVGVQLFSGNLLDGTLQYQLAGVNGNLDGGSNDGDVTNGKDIIGRLFATPLVNSDVGWAKGLGLGLAGDYGQTENDNLLAVNLRTMGRATFFKFATTAPKSSTLTASTKVNVTDGNRRRFAPQAYYYWGPVGFMSEGFFNWEDVKQTRTFAKPKTGPTPAPRVTEITAAPYGWFAQASYVLTGEDASYKGVTPINPFDPRQGRWGAFELAFRASGVHLGQDLFNDGFASTTSTSAGSTESALEYTFGLNWYLNRVIKFQLNYGRTNFGTPITFGSIGPVPRTHEDVILTDFQVAF